MPSGPLSSQDAFQLTPIAITQLVTDLQKTDPHVSSELILLVYNELRRLAAFYLKDERAGHTLQPTALVHEAYLRLANENSFLASDRKHFLAVAAITMRRILVDHARERLRDKRGAGMQRVPMHEGILSRSECERLVGIDQALEQLDHLDPRQSRIVQLRYFVGLTVEETARSARHLAEDGQTRLEHG